MAFNGSGTFVRNNGTHTGSTVWAQDAAAGTNIVDTIHDTHDQDLANGLTNCITKDGQTTPTADIPMGSNKITGLANGTAITHAATVGQVQLSSNLWGGTSTGSSNAYAISLSPAPSGYGSGLTVKFIANFTNTGATTLNINGLGALSVLTIDGDALIGDEIISGSVIECLYESSSGGRFFLTSTSKNQGTASWTPTLGTSGTMTFGSTSITTSKYQIHGTTCHIWFTFAGTIGGSPLTDGITVSLPATSGAVAQAAGIPYTVSGGYDVVIGDIPAGSSTLTITHPGSDWDAVATTFKGQLSYLIA